MRLAWLVLGASLVAGGAPAQVVDPVVVQFLPSPDHSVISSTGQPIVSRYDLEVYAVGASAPFQTTNMGKPAPQADGNVYFDFTGQVVSWPLPGGTYESRVAAVGPFGTSRSAPSNPFTMSPPGANCTYTLTPTTVSVGAGGGSASVSITTGASCAWSITGASSWVTVSPTSGTGSGTVTLAAAPNGLVTARTETFNLGYQAITLYQAANVTCTYSMTPSMLSIPETGGAGSVTVTAPVGCGWTARPADAWATATPASSNGSGTVTVSVGPNPGSLWRSTIVTVAGQSIDVKQGPSVCGYTVSPASVALGPEAGTFTLTVGAPAGCSWTASSNATWASVTTSSASNGSGSVTLSVAANPSTSARAATITVGGQSVTVTQSGITCTYSVSPIAIAVGAGGGSPAVRVLAPAACSWTASWSAPWISGNAGASSGNGVVMLTIAPNTAIGVRRASILVAGQSVSVEQASASCSFSVPSTPISVPAEGGKAVVPVTAPAGCAWTVSPGASWATFSPGSGSGPGSVTVTVPANPAASLRSTTLIVAGQAVAVNQSAAACTFSVSPTTVNLGGLGKKAIVNVTAPMGCAWTATTAVNWFTVLPPNGNGNGSVTLTSTSNGIASQRADIATVAQQPVTVTQSAAAACTGAISPGGMNVAQAGGSGSFSLKADCSWSVASDSPWLTVANPVGTGSDTIRVNVAANPGRSSRKGTLTVAGQAFVVRQEGQKPGRVNNVSVITSAK